ncbi:MAG: potassium channel family protein [Planctomycetota bacterium]
MSRRRFAVLGLGEFGSALAQELAKVGCEVLAVDHDPKRVDPLRDRVMSVAVADVRDRDALRQLLSTPFDGAVVAIGDVLEASILATLHLKELGVGEIIVEATSPERATVLERVGATRVVSPDAESGRQLARRLANPNLLEFIPLATGFGVIELEAPAWAKGKTLAELDLRKKWNLAVIALRSPDAKVTLVPGGAARVEERARLTLVGRDADLARFREKA